MLETLKVLARERGVDIRATLPEGALLVQGDRDELLRVVENLVENAVKYGESGGRVEVELRAGDGSPGHLPQAELSVRDHGPGIAPEHLPRLTERFYRADVAQSRDKGGTGLGLAIVKHIVNRHRGQLEIQSELGQGALFKVTLPLSADQPAVTA
jgi:two-component system phosphate regulon sensor histidine kinase PhoR